MRGQIVSKKTTLENDFQCFFQHWIPENARSLVVMVHGLGDHISRNQGIVSYLVNRGHACALYDQRGHGLSEGKRGHVDSFDQWVDDLRSFFEFTKASAPDNIPIFLLGGSLGGLISFFFITHTKEKISGLISVAAAIKPKISVPDWKLRIARKLGSKIPSYTVFNGLKFENLSRNLDEIELLEHDRLFHRRISLGAAIDIENKLRLVMTLPCQISLPSLFLTGSDDRICLPEGSKKFSELIASPDKQCIVYDEMKHDILHDYGSEQVLEDIERWLSQRVVQEEL